MSRLALALAVALVPGVDISPAQEKAASNEEIRRFIDDLDHPIYRIREQAQRDLVEMGDKAIAAVREAAKHPASAEAERRLRLILVAHQPSIFEAHANGWHWVYSTIAHAQTFEATGATVETLKIRVAQLSANRPTAPLEVEIRDPKFETIYVKGTIDAKVLEREFRWQEVKLTHAGRLKPGQPYALLFHSMDNRNTSPWAINAIYHDVYPKGRHGVHAHEDFFFAIDYKDGKSLRVGPDGEKTQQKLPINSGAEGGAVDHGGVLTLQNFGAIPQGKLQESEKH